MDIHNVQFPLANGAPGFKGLLKTRIGLALAPFMVDRAARLQSGDIGEQLSLADRLLIAGLVHRHEREGTLEALNGLHDWLWSSDQAVQFHEQAQARFQSWWIEQHSAIVAPLLDELSDRPGAYTSLCEIGCGSGLVLDDLSRRLPQLQRFYGLDLSAAQTRRNRMRFGADARLRFESGDAAAWLKAHAEPGWIYFSNAGVLEYFPEPKLREMLRHLAGRAPATFAMVEPIDQGFDLQRETASRAYGSERSWSHNYPHLFRECGFTPRWQRELDFAGLRWLMVLATA